MTTAEQFRAAAAHPTSGMVSIAGVPWPAYKVIALVIGVVVLGVVAVTTVSASAGVLSGAAATTVVWIAARPFWHER